MIDALLDVPGRTSLPPAASPLAALPSGADWKPRLILVTAHRRESSGQGLREICTALREIAERRANNARIVYPVHLNPNLKGPVRGTLGGLPSLTVLAPLDYQSLVSLMMQCYLLLTDSGELQQEAPSLGKPVLAPHTTTERPEAVKAGTSRSVGADAAKIVAVTFRC